MHRVLPCLVWLVAAGCGSREPNRAAIELVPARPWPTPSAVPSASGATTCRAGLIDGTDVCDTPAAREVIDFCEVYRRAVESREVPRLLALASLDYHDDGGSADPADDLTRASLEAYLNHEFRNVSAVRYEIRYHSIEPGPPIRVRLGFAASFLIDATWNRRVGDTTLVLEREHGELRIASGM